MILALGIGVLMALGAVAQPPSRPPVFVRDSSVADSAGRGGARRLPVTAEVLATAFRDDAARTLFYRARAARMTQDSALRGYDATVRARASIGIGIGERGPERLAFRQEAVTRVRWQHDVGARVEVVGARYVAPIIGTTEVHARSLEDIANGVGAIPYFPGYEPLWIGGIARAEVDDRRIVNPLAEGAEAYYTYASGDSLRIAYANVPDRWLRELRVRPRSPGSNVVIGSMMFDIASGHLARATYRLAAPIEVAPVTDSATGARIAFAIAKGVIGPMRMTLSEVTIEYGIYQGRFLLPRARRMTGTQQMSFVRAPVTVELAFQYASVNGDESLAPIETNRPDRLVADSIRAPDSLDAAAARTWRDSVRVARDSLERAFIDSLGKAPCDSTGTRTVARYDPVTRLTAAVTFPCDLEKLVSASELPRSIYNADEEAFGSADRDALIAGALSLGAQASIGLFQLPPPRFQYGVPMTRYNRIEGFSTGLLVEQHLGGGYFVTASGRYGLADDRLIGEVAFGRTNLRRSIALGAYDRLVSTSEWGHPLSVGASVSALLFGRDEAFYYRASGIELRFRAEGGSPFDWRFFAERQRSALQETTRSFGGQFLPNIAAAPVSSVGSTVRVMRSYGLDPRGLRLSTDLRLEGVTGDSTYGRGAMDVMVSRGLPMNLVGTLTLAAGSSIGGVPAQRLWYLGGTQTIRGQRPDSARRGNAFWMTRAELGVSLGAVRPSVFGDIGWAGDRAMTSKIGRPISGIGIGLSAFDGILRLDLARGIFPSDRVRVDLSIGGRW